MYDYVRIAIYLISFLFSAYILTCIDFLKLIRSNQQAKGQILYILLSLALGYLVAQFILGLSLTYVL